MGNYRQVDEYPFGGAKSMVLRADVLKRAIESIPDFGAYRVVMPSPKGAAFSQGMAARYAAGKGIIFVIGFYEGIDARLREWFPIEEVRLGDAVLTSGETPALAIADATARLLPGVVGNPKSVASDSFQEGLLEYPQYTQPRDIEGVGVPEVLVSGHHGKVAAWQRRESLRETLFKRPELLADFVPEKGDLKLFGELLGSSAS